MKRKQLIEERLNSLKSQKKKATIWAYVWFILGTPTIIFGGWIMYIFGAICISKTKKIDKEIFDIEIKE